LSERNLNARIRDAEAALAAIRDEANDRDNRVIAAEAKAKKAEKKAAKDRAERDATVGKFAELEDALVAAKAETASRVATLEAEAEILAMRDRDARDELDRLRATKDRSE
jgi:predicted  nucleic acid-binding Zn-ribbon protein